MKDKISIIIPVYNVEEYLEKCLESIINQNFDKVEIIIVDDGSTDKSLQIAKEYQKKYPEKTRVISQENKGQGGARNTGIKNATGKYLLFVDSDDTIKSGMLETLYTEMEKSNADIVLFGFEYVDEKGKVIRQRTEFNDEYMEFTLQDQPYLFTKDGYIWDKIYKTSLFVENGIWFPERMWYEDLNVEAKILLCADKIVFINKIFYEYLQRDGSTMHNCDIEKNRDMIYMVQDILEYYKAKGMFEKYYEQLEFLVGFHILILCTLRIASSAPNHSLLHELNDFAYAQFPDIKLSEKELPLKYRMVYRISTRKQYWLLWIMNKVQKIFRK